MRRLQATVDLLVKVLNGGSVSLGGSKGEMSEHAVKRLRQLCTDLGELERIRAALSQREPQAIDPDPADAADRVLGRAWPYWQLKDSASRELSANGESILERVNNQLKCLRTREAVRLDARARGSRLVRWNPIGFKDFLTTCWLYLVLELLESGHIHLLRLCQRGKCKRWFSGRTEWQKYCSRNCRQLEAAQGERFKEKRKEYMHSYRQEEKRRKSQWK